MFVINELSERDWREYMSIRLRSLKDTPDSFASTYEREAAFTPEQWKSRLRISPDFHSAVAFGAIADQSLIGLTSSVIHKSDTSTAHLFQMWVNPDYRGNGIGSALVDRINSWAIDRNVRKILLSVTTINTEAIALYQSMGFNPEGNVEPLREGSSLKSQTMVKTINASNPPQ